MAVRSSQLYRIKLQHNNLNKNLKTSKSCSYLKEMAAKSP